ncbi:DUF4340 domain-containing protein [Thermodesulforhabdus norvegica]|uniref:DUF4340 domain-containing protein n=1 Tax=Thermodesulforhabdus norvegica TaxID=39841 RepID=A0A1I4UW79_9BACT|nr:DUF4340 domain-containing protein [Thermodesulforhabdus norvegica]SFM93158.1 protein of unknown function [Thermodesulforhabdus norvegica]
MKWKSLAVYGLILLILAGFYYYVDVYKRKEKEKAELQARKVFDFSPDKISEVRVVRSDGKTVKLVKEEKGWVIREPLQAAADDASVKGLLNVMADLEADRWIDVKGGEAGQYGLDRPNLVIEAVDSEGKHVLSVGIKNPAETHYYARVGESKRVFLMSASRWNILNKDVYDLRRKELAVFQNDDVEAITVSWADGGSVEVKKESDKWFSPQEPDVKIKSSKVENVIDQIRWLRARKFLDELTGGEDGEGSLLSKYGLDKPEVKVDVLLQGGKKIRIAFAEPEEGSNTELVAYSSDLGSIVNTDRDVLGELPKTLHDLEDRSLFTWQEESVGRLVWKKKERSVEITRAEDDKWKVSVNGGKSEELEEGWRIRSVFWDLEDLEYEKELKPVPSLPAEPLYGLTFFDTDKEELARWIWNELPAEEEEKESPERVVTLWVVKGEKVEKAVEVKASLLGDIVDKLDNTVKDLEKDEKKEENR